MQTEMGANPVLIFHIQYKSGYRNTGLRVITKDENLKGV